MRLGDVASEGAQPFGKPLDGVRVLAAEQMQALPYATQMLSRLGADVVKVEHPEHGESGRASTPAMVDPQGRQVGATYLRNNFNKRSIGIDLKAPEGRELFLALVPHFDVIAENFKPGTMERMGLGYDAIAAQHPGAIYVSISGFGNTVDTPYRDWPAYASIVEAMSGIYDYRHPDEPPVTIPVGALGDISSALFGVSGILAALRHREHTGQGQYVDTVIRPAVDAWASTRTTLGAAQELTAAGIVAGPSNHAADVIADPHVAARHMLVEMPRTDDVDQPILVPGNPVKLSKMAEGPETRVPWVGEHTAELLAQELGLDDAELARLRDRGIIT